MTIAPPRINRRLMEESREEAERTSASLRREMSFVDSFGVHGTGKQINRLMRQARS